MKFRSRRVAGLIALVAVCSGFALASGPANAASSPLKYVALGDSYSAASGVLPVDPTAPQCLRSTRNYPQVLAKKIGAKLTDVTCGAADTTHFFKPQYPGMKPQLDALKSDTGLVTMTIGGNDSGVFINAILDCGSAGLSTLGTGSPCKDKYGSSFEDTIRNTTYPSLVKALGAVRKKSPKARVAILSYPWITPKTGGCFPTMPIATGDVPYVRSLQSTLNDAVRRAAVVTGVTFVNFNGVSEGHDACKPIGTRWVEPVLAGTNPVIVHPNSLGEAKMAEQADKVLSKVPEGPGPAVESPGPTVVPQTRIRKSVLKGARRKAKFRFTSSVAGSRFRCSLDRRPFRKCKSPRTYRHLKPGKHRFRVKATAAGKTDPTPVKKRFRIRR